MGNGSERPPMPLALKTAIGVLFFQVLTNAAGGVLMFVFAAEDVDHGREVPTLTYVLAFVSLAIAVTLLVCTVSLMRRVEAVRPVVAGIEVLGILNGGLGLVLGAPQAVAGLVLSILVLVHIYRREVTEWLDPLPGGWDDADTGVAR